MHLLNIVYCLLIVIFSFKVGQTASPSCNPGCLVNPCQNGGGYKPFFPTDFKTPRFKCSCPGGYAGDLCQHRIKSCRGYNSGSRTPGIYKIFDDNTDPFYVFCDFDLNSTNAWTLVQSYQLQYQSSFEYLPFTKDLSINATSPRWDVYRLSKLRMKSIQEDSSKFRMTCNYDTEGVVYRDYLQVATDQLDILTFTNGDSCSRVERINIRGQSCENCTAYIYQGGAYKFALHSDSYYSSWRGCEFRPTGGLYCTSSGEDNFGVYRCFNPAHRCSSSQLSTTQTWFGSL